MSACPICKYELLKEPEDFAENPNDDACTIGSFFDCPRCGYYGIDEIASHYMQEILQNNKAMALSYYIRKRSEKEDNPLIIQRDELLNFDAPLPDAFEQAHNLVRFMGENCLIGEYIELEDRKHGGIIGAASQEGFHYVAHSLVKNEILEPINPRKHYSYGVRLSFAGWERFNDIKRGNLESTRAFMAMPFKYDDLTELVNTHFRPAVEATGFSLFRLDDEPRAGLIDDWLALQIQNCRFLIADVTHENLNVSWEAGYAEGLGKHVIYTCDETRMKDAHFDISHRQTIVWDKDNMPSFVENLKASIRVTIPEATRED